MGVCLVTVIVVAVVINTQPTRSLQMSCAKMKVERINVIHGVTVYLVASK